MTDWEILRYVHQIGSPMKGTVVAREDVEVRHGIPVGNLTLNTSSPYRALLPAIHLVDDLSAFSPDVIPSMGQEIEAVVFNFVDGILYLSAKPSDLAEESIKAWRDFYEYIDTLEIGAVVEGIVTRSAPFGLFVDLGGPYVGLVDIVQTDLDGGVPLPRDYSTWPKEGEAITCRVRYVRLHGMQLGLSWQGRV